MGSGIEPVLYIDMQALRPAGYCESCGAEIYTYGGSCRYCEERDL